MKPMMLFFMIIAGFVSNSFSSPQIGDTLSLGSWFSLTGEKGQVFEANGYIDTIIVNGNESVYKILINRQSVDSRWIPFFPAEGIEVSITVLARKPDNVSLQTSYFENCDWITGIHSEFQFIGDREFYFPILPKNRPYVNIADAIPSYMVRLNDTVGVKCELGNMQFNGKIIRFTNKNDTDGTVIDIEKPLQLLSSDNPFRFGGIIINSDISQWVEMDVCCGSGFYALEINSYKPFYFTQVIRSVQSPIKVIGSNANRQFDMSGRIVSSQKTSASQILAGNGMHKATIILEK